MSALDELKKKNPMDLTMLEYVVTESDYRELGGNAEEAAEELAKKDAELSALRAEVEKNREIISDANELLWEFTENPKMDVAEFAFNRIEEYFRKYNAPSEGQKRE